MKTIVTLLILYLLSYSSCTNQKTPLLVKDRTEKDSEISIVDALSVIDPYFNGNNSIINYNGPKSITRNIVQDNTGDYWFATWEGIYHYNGQHFTNYTNKNNLPRFRVFSLLEDAQERMWFGTIGKGIFYSDINDRSEKEFINLSSLDGLINDDVGCISQDSDGNIWFGTRVGISRYDGKVFENFTDEDGLPNHDVNAIVEDDNGVLWIGARGFASQYNGETFSLILNEGKPFSNVRSIIKDSNGNIWLGGNDGLWCYNNGKFYNYTESFIGNIYEDSKGTIWVSQSSDHDVYRMCLYRYDRINLSPYEYKAKMIKEGDGQVFGIIEDSNGVIWFGNEKGVCNYNGTLFNCFDC